MWARYCQRLEISTPRNLGRNKTFYELIHKYSNSKTPNVAWVRIISCLTLYFAMLRIITTKKPILQTFGYQPNFESFHFLNLQVTNFLTAEVLFGPAGIIDCFYQFLTHILTSPYPILFKVSTYNLLGLKLCVKSLFLPWYAKVLP